MIKGIRAIIFDLDGTLVSSSLDFSAMRREIGCPPEEDILGFIAKLKGEQRQTAESIVYQHEMADAQSVSLIPGVRELLDELSEKGLHTAIVTRNSVEATSLKLSQVDIGFDHVLTRECAPAKPDPGSLLQLCETWNIKTDEAVYVGDYLYDLLAAENAQMHSCLFVQNQEPEYAHKAGFICRDYQFFCDELERYVLKK